MLLEKLTSIHEKFLDTERQLADPANAPYPKRMTQLARERRQLMQIEEA